MDKLLSDSKYPRKLWKFQEHITSPIGIQSHITKIRIQLSGGIEQYNLGQAQL